MERVQRWAGRLGPALLGVAWFFAKGGWFRLDPRNVGWLFDGDWAQELLGWLFYRHEPLRFPLGRLDGLAYPVGTTLGFADSNPWVSLLLRPFSALLPLYFQFNGAWLCLCYVLQATAGAWVLRTLRAGRVAQLLGAGLFLVAPVLESRLGHLNLCAQFFIVALIALHVTPAPMSRPEALRAMGVALLACIWSSGTHPYLGAMVTLLSLALALRLWLHDRAFARARAVLALAAPVLASLGTFALFGYLSAGVPQRGSGFGEISADLLTLVNPNRSRLFPALDLPRLKDEGYGYLGLGIIALAVLSLALLFFPGASRVRAKAEHRARLFLYLAATLAALFSFADVWTWAGKPLLDLRRLYAPLRSVVEAYRASGRFIWPLHYVILTVVIAAVVRRFGQRRYVVEGLLLLALCLQLLDVSYQFPRTAPVNDGWRLDDTAWELARGSYAHLALAPPVLHDGAGHGCAERFPEQAYHSVGMLAYRLGMTSNSMYVTRLDGDRAHAACDALERSLHDGSADAKTLYVVHPTYWAEMTRPGSSFVCAPVSRLPVCVLATNQDAFAQELGRRRAGMPRR